LSANPIAKACKHVTYVRAQDQTKNDALVIKEHVVYDDGSSQPQLTVVENYKRAFWVNYPNYRTYKDKRFFESQNRLQKFTSTQNNLLNAINKVLGYPSPSLQVAANSPYLYGIDVSTPTLMKHEYIERWPEHNGDRATDNTIAALDIETDMFDENAEPIIASVTMKDRAYMVVVRSFFGNMPHIEDKIKDAVRTHLADKVKQRQLALDVEVFENAGAACVALIQKLHEWKPDILSIWNVNFDIKKILETFERYGHDPALIFSDPSVPKRYRYFRYKEGKSQKETASGKFMALHPAEQWHVVETPASFYVLDAMCVYLRLRIAAGKEPSYKLDAILKKHGCDGKFVFPPAAHLKDAAWQKYMQERYKIEYCVYNLMDCIALEELDEVTHDLKRQISTISGPSEYSKFSSQPRRLCDDLHFELLADGKVIGCTGIDMKDDLDQLTMGLHDWIVTLPSHLTQIDHAVPVAELGDQSSKIYTSVADLDITGTYPSEQCILNISKETTTKEICRIQGLPESAVRAFGINLTGGFVNAVELCCSVMGAPTLDRLLKDFQSELSGVAIEDDPPGAVSDYLYHDNITVFEEEVDETEE